MSKKNPAMMDPKVISDFLEDQRENVPDHLQEHYLAIEDFWDRKLWHELAGSLLAFFEDPAAAPLRLPLYHNFLLSFAEKINQREYVHLGLIASAQTSDAHERHAFISQIATKVNKAASQDAYVYALVNIAEMDIALNDLASAKKNLDKAESILDTIDSLEQELVQLVHASFYRISSIYAQKKEDNTAYYRNSLHYLACLDITVFTDDEAGPRIIAISFAALVSDSIYNFGELLLHPMLEVLTDTPFEWVRDLLYAFNRGDLRAYNILEAHMSEFPKLEKNKEFLWQKLTLCALTEAVFRRPPHDRTMTFASISQETRVQPDQVEILIMKALSLGLLRGNIDQVAQVARITWVQPKVLDMQQIENMRVRLKDWDSSVNDLGQWIERIGKDVWAA